MSDRLIASDLSQLVLQRRRDLGELQTPPLNETYQRAYAARAEDAAIVSERVSGELEPLVNEIGDRARHGS